MRKGAFQMRICIFGAASPTIDAEYIEKVEALGEKLAKRGHSLVFGGGANGLMGAAARGVRDGGGRLLGVIPSFFKEDTVERLCDFCDEILWTETMRERKQLMEDNSDAFIIVPGGIGTYEEFFEILTSKQLCRHNKPIAIYNIGGFYDKIVDAMKNAIEKGFIKESCLDLFCMTEDTDKLFEYIEAPAKEIKSIKELKDG